jgi:excisionase family DNA binding protein
MDNTTSAPSARKRSPATVSLDSGRAAFRITELVQLLPLCRAKITKMVDSGELRSVRVGGVRVVPRDEVVRILSGD